MPILDGDALAIQMLFLGANYEDEKTKTTVGKTKQRHLNGWPHALKV